MDRRHIQNASEAAYQIPHWGYASRSYPCTNDAGSCEYLDAVYWMHDVSMLYTFIMWMVLAGILFVWLMLRWMKPAPIATVSRRSGEQVDVTMSESVENALYRGTRAIAASFRRRLLIESPIRYFGHVTRLQLLILAILAGYLTIFSFVGIVYKTWITPVKNSTLYNTRTGLGGYADRIGAFAYALTPLTVMLSTRESILTLFTGISYQHFNFLHRWCGRIIFIQSAVHTLGWTLIEARFYQPQPKVYREFIAQEYMIYGCVAMGLLSFLYVFSIRRVIQWTGHAFFIATHFIVAALYVGACWGHWKQLNCWLIASLVVMFLDMGIRLLRVVSLHVGFVGARSGFGFHSAQATLEHFEDNGGVVIRMDFDHPQSPWRPGQHFFLTFPALSVWQSHPFTVASSPNPKSATQHHTYIIRSLNGETSKLAKLAKTLSGTGEKTSVIMMGPYGSEVLCEAPNVLAIAGGTGISFTVPLAAEVLRRNWNDVHALKLVWVVRQSRDVEWMMPELQRLREMAAKGGTALDIHIYVSRESQPESTTSPGEKDKELQDTITITALDSSKDSRNSLSSSSKRSSLAEAGFRTTWLGNAHPVLEDIVREALDDESFSHGSVQVVASGPASMGRDLRRAVAVCNDGGKVWKGQEAHDVSLHWDDRAY